MFALLRENSAAVLGALVTMLVAAVGVISAEGGHQRRMLKQAREGLEVIALLRTEASQRTRATNLQTRVDRVLDEYLLTGRARWKRRALRVFMVWFYILAAAALYGIVVGGARSDANIVPAGAPPLRERVEMALVAASLVLTFFALQWRRERSTGREEDKGPAG